MSVTLNYTSKGLIDAIQKQLAQQKSEGKINGDISYSKIVTCDFWDAIKTINDSHDNNNKVYHGIGFSCDDRAEDTNWTKTVVVYGSTTFTDDEWAILLRSMGLQLTPKTEEEKGSVTKETPKEESAPETEEKFKPVSKEVMALLQHKLGDNSAIKARELLKAGYTFDIDNDTQELRCFNKQGDKISFNEISNIANALSADNESKASIAETETETATITESDNNENCIEDEE